jgi:hypothetical protein
LCPVRNASFAANQKAVYSFVKRHIYSNLNQLGILMPLVSHIEAIAALCDKGSTPSSIHHVYTSRLDGTRCCFVDVHGSIWTRLDVGIKLTLVNFYHRIRFSHCPSCRGTENPPPNRRLCDVIRHSPTLTFRGM